MSKLDELLRELCPDGVEHKKLVDAVSIERGKRVVRSQLSISGKYPVYQNSLTPLGYHTDYNYNANTTFIIVAGAAGEIGFSDKAFWAADDCFAVVCPENILNRYIYHLLLNNQNQLVSKVRKASIPRLSRSAIENLVIPLPPIEVQREIVRMLDNYTKSVVGLQKQLTAEFTARKTQYSFYRSRLLTFDANVEWKTVDEIAEVTDYVANGSFAALKENVNYKHTPDYAILVRTTDLVNGFDEENLVYIDKHAYNYLSKSKLYGGEIIINNIGAGVGTTFLCPCLDTYMSLAPNSIMVKTNNNKFYYYWLNSKEGQNAIRKIVSQGSLPKFNKTGFRSIRLPVPPLDVQNRIVNVLDNFEKICSDLNIGLPAEIEARQKQYEYYRDKLLTFAENGNTILSRAEQSRALIKLLQYVFGYVRISLGDIGSICMCKRILKSQTNTVSGVPFYKIGTFGKEADAYISQETFNEYRSKYNFPKKGDVLISAAGTIGRTVVYDGKPAYFQDSNIVWIDNDESIVLNSYLRYCYELKPWKASEGGTIPRLYNDNIAKAVIAVPSIEEQKCVVSILDRFDAICNDLTSGLPAEIEARQKQYEYYRDKLLSFKELT